MKQKVFTLLTLLVLCVTGAWADNYYILSGKCNVPLTAGMASAKNQVLKSNGSSVVATTAISSSQTGAGSAFYYNSTSASYANLTDTGNYGAAAGNETMSPIKIESGNTMTITLNSKTFTKMDVLYACKSKDAKSITIDGTVYNTNDQNVHIASKTKGFATSIAISNSSGKEYNVIVILTEQTYDISFALPDGATGIAPATINDGAGETITLPKNFTMYKANSTFKGWDANNDGTEDYAGGANYTVTGAATLKAVFEDNGGTTLDDRTLATTITFDFQRKNGAPTVTWQAPTLPTSGVWMAQANVAGKTIDVKMDWDVTTSGAKINNSSWNDWAQLNNGTQFVIPSAAGATVDIEAYNNTDDETTVNGAVRTSVSGNTSHYEISSSAATATIVMSGKASYYRTIKVTLPGPTYDVNFNLSNVTKTSGDATVMGGTVYTATFAAADGYGLPATVTVTAGATDISANCTWSAGTLTIPAAYTTDDITITVNGVALAGSEIIRATITAANTATPSGTLYKTTTTNLSGKDSGKSGWKFSGNGSYVLLTLADGYTFKKGDIVNVHITAAAGQGTMAIYSSGNDVLQDTGVKGAEGDNKVVLSADVDGQQSIKFLRTSTNTWNAHIDYISVTRPYAVVTLNASGFATYSKATDFTFEGAKAYKMALNEGTKTIAGTEVSGKIAAGEGVLLKGAANAPVAIMETTGAVALADNDLKGSTKSDGSLAVKPTYCYVLSGDTFKKFTGGTLTANKAYFEATVDLKGHALTMTFDDGETTAIKAVEAKKVENGVFYNLAGQQVAQPTKGLYIVNGRKVIVK